MVIKRLGNTNKSYTLTFGKKCLAKCDKVTQLSYRVSGPQVMR